MVRTGEREPSAGLQLVDRVMVILTTFTMDEPAWALSDLARAVGMHRSTVLRILRALEKWGMVQRQDDHYRLGLKALEMGAVVQSQLEIRSVARPLLEALVAGTQEMAFLSVYDRGEIVYIEKVDCPQPVRSVAQIGRRLPAHAATTGKVLLAHQPAEELERVLASGLQALTPNTITNPTVLQAELDKVRAQGYAIDNEEVQPQVRGVAAPVRSHTGRVVAAVGIAGPTFRLQLENLGQFAAAVSEAARAISRNLGCLDGAGKS